MEISMSDSLGAFIKSNWAALLSVFIAASAGYSDLRSFKLKSESDFYEVKARIEQIEKNGVPPVRERLQSIESRTSFNEQRLSGIELDAKQTAQVISEFRSDLRLVVEWVKDQKRKDIR